MDKFIFRFISWAVIVIKEVFEVIEKLPKPPKKNSTNDIADGQSFQEYEMGEDDSIDDSTTETRKQ
jgi:hypothetical protein